MADFALREIAQHENQPDDQRDRRPHDVVGQEHRRHRDEAEIHGGDNGDVERCVFHA